MYRCSHCEETFSEPTVDRQRFQFDIYGCRAECETYHCPYCGHDDFYELDKCCLCGTFDDLEDGLCEFCRENAKCKLQQFLTSDFTDAEIEYLEHLFDATLLERTETK